MQTTDAQVRRLMEEIHKHGGLGLAALRAGMDRKTARKYVRAGKFPSELRKPHTWRTREDPFAQDWPVVAAMLEEAPELEARTLLDHLVAQRGEVYAEGQLRTLQRRVREWRARHGPEREVFFPQAHRPGEAMQTDFTHATELGVTICGEPFDHQLCHSVLPFSNWEWATVCHSESMSALRRGVQSTLFRLGQVPEFHQTDNSTAATHDLPTGKRGFNDEYQTLMDHLGMKPRTIGIGEKEQNGDIEASHGVLKSRLKQHLLLRGSRDFESVEAYEHWLWEKIEAANRLRQAKLAEELSVMRVLMVSRLPEYREESVVVTSWSTIRVKRNAYSVPSRLIGETVRARVYEQRVEVYHGSVLQLAVQRLRGEGGHRINYRHVIWSLVQKPGAFARYRYREDLFPSLTFRRAYDALTQQFDAWKADVEYLRILHLAASTMENEVEQALVVLLEADQCPAADAIKRLVAPQTIEVPELEIPAVDLASYDSLLDGEVGAAHEA
ncbi:MAG: IS21 family transposase [Deltaproteobacteria bacterium]|nr:IS21 family transposase [Deltaproteobacteria bacterium]